MSRNWAASQRLSTTKPTSESARPIRRPHSSIGSVRPALGFADRVSAAEMVAEPPAHPRERGGAERLRVALDPLQRLARFVLAIFHRSLPAAVFAHGGHAA